MYIAFLIRETHCKLNLLAIHYGFEEVVIRANKEIDSVSLVIKRADLATKHQRSEIKHS